MNEVVTPYTEPKVQVITDIVAKGFLNAIPFAGGFAADLYGRALSPIEKRKAIWMDEVEIALNELSQKYNFTPEKLCDNQSFISAVMKASQIAIQTHRKEKIRALKRVLVDIGSKASSEDDGDSYFLIMNAIEALSVNHFKIISFLQLHNYEISALRSIESIYTLFVKCENTKSDRVEFRAILADLSSRMLIHLGDIDDMEEYKSWSQTIALEDSSERPLSVTKFGTRLLEMILSDDEIEQAKN